MTLHRGEVVGVGGLLGSGRTELARLLFGLDRSDSGELRVDGKPVRFDTPRRRRSATAWACAPKSASTTASSPTCRCARTSPWRCRRASALWKVLSRARQQEIAERFVRTLGIKVADIETPIALLSGGNQQKVVLARWLATDPRL